MEGSGERHPLFFIFIADHISRLSASLIFFGLRNYTCHKTNILAKLGANVEAMVIVRTLYCLSCNAIPVVFLALSHQIMHVSPTRKGFSFCASRIQSINVIWWLPDTLGSFSHATLYLKHTCSVLTHNPVHQTHLLYSHIQLCTSHTASAILPILNWPIWCYSCKVEFVIGLSSVWYRSHWFDWGITSLAACVSYTWRALSRHSWRTRNPTMHHSCCFF